MHLLDLECDGLYDTVTKIHCATIYDTDTQEWTQFTPETIHNLSGFLNSCPAISCHNFIGYDGGVLKKILNYEYKGTVVDTLVLSRILWPDRKEGHGLEAWGEAFGIKKPEHEDWSTFSPEMLHRNKEDVRIQIKLYEYIVKTIRDYQARDDRIGNSFSEALRMEQKVWSMMEESAHRGWQFDLQLAYELVEQLSTKLNEIEKELVPMLPKRVIQVSKTEDGSTKAFKADGTLTKAAVDWIKPFYYSEYSRAGHPTQFVMGDFCKVRFEDFNIGSSAQVKEYLLANGWEPKEYNYKKDRFGKPVRDNYGKMIKTGPKVPKTAEDWQEVADTIGLPSIVLLAERNKASHRRSQIQGLIDNTRMDHRIEAQAITCATNCVIAGTLIQTDCGLIPIEKVQRGDLILTHEGKYESCEDFIQNGIKPVYRVRTTSGREIVATENHPFWNGEEFILLKDLKVGDSTFVYSDPLVWKVHPQGNYYVSNTGLIQNFDGANLCADDLSAERRRALYQRGRIDVFIDGKQRRKTKGQLVLETFVGLRPEGKECCHRDGNPTNNHLENLYWGTSKENSADQSLHGTNLRAQRRGKNTKLTQDVVDRIRFDFENNWYLGFYSHECKKYGVCMETVRKICNNETWVTRDEDIENQYRVSFMGEEISSVEYVGDFPTFDITVKDLHSYVANGYVVHNTRRMAHRTVVNIPKAKPNIYYGKQMRSLFIASPGKVLVGADASALEARCEAHYVMPYDRAAALELINGDIHSLNAEVFQTTRDIAKNGKYAILYGCSPAKLAATIGKPLSMAQEIYEAYWDSNPGLKLLKEDLEKQYEKYGYILAIDGTPLTVRYKHALLNTLLQSCGSIAVKYALCFMDKEIKSRKLDVQLLGVFHDEAQFECNSSVAEEAGQLMVGCLKTAGEYLKLNVELTGEFKTGKSWDLTH